MHRCLSLLRNNVRFCGASQGCPQKASTWHFLIDATAQTVERNAMHKIEGQFSIFTTIHRISYELRSINKDILVISNLIEHIKIYPTSLISYFPSYNKFSTNFEAIAEYLNNKEFKKPEKENGMLGPILHAAWLGLAAGPTGTGHLGRLPLGCSEEEHSRLDTGGAPWRGRVAA
jgi:hypothetical protein